MHYVGLRLGDVARTGIRKVRYQARSTQPAYLLSAILARGITVQIKGPFNKSIPGEKPEPLSGLREENQCNAESVKGKPCPGGTLICTYDEYSLNSYPQPHYRNHRGVALLRHDIPQARKRNFAPLDALFFKEVKCFAAGLDRLSTSSTIAITKTYRMLISVVLSGDQRGCCKPTRTVRGELILMAF